MLDKEMLAQEGELEPFANSSSALAAIDYIVSLSSDVFMPSHGGNMGRAIQGHRTYAGHRKSIKPNKRWMLPTMLDGQVESPSNTKIKGLTLAPEEVSCMQREALEMPEMRTEKRGRDVVVYPVPEWMCRRNAYLPFSIK